jgi:transcription antitermination factor NusB
MSSVAHNATEADHCGTQSDAFSYIMLSRRDIRAVIFHILYALEAFEYQESVRAIIDNFNRGFDMDVPLDGEVYNVVEKVSQQREELDTTIKPLLVNWRLERIGVCTKLILRLAVWELQQKETAPNIIINEAIELAKCFAEKDAYKFINGILDEAAKMVK